MKILVIVVDDVVDQVDMLVEVCELVLVCEEEHSPGAEHSVGLAGEELHVLGEEHIEAQVCNLGQGDIGLMDFYVELDEEQVKRYMMVVGYDRNFRYVEVVDRNVVLDGKLVGDVQVGCMIVVGGSFVVVDNELVEHT